MIEYRKSGISDIEPLIKLRLMFLYESNHVDAEDEKNNLFESNRAFFQKGISDGSFIAFVAIDNGKIVATSGLSLYYLPPNKKCTDGKVAYISNMYTIPQYRKKGIASKLFSMTVQEAIHFGHKKILLNATEMGRPIYEKYGFKDAQNNMVYYVE